MHCSLIVRFCFLSKFFFNTFSLATNLSPVPETDDVRSGRKPVPNDDYYKTLEFVESDSNYTTMPNALGRSDDSVIISVPTMLREEDDIAMTTDGGESIYNQNNSIQSFEKKTYRNHQLPTSITVGYCQTDMQTLDPKYFFKLTEHSLLADHRQMSTYDSGFFDSLSSISRSSSINNN